MEELKYVITDNNDFAIFSKHTNHSDIGRVLWGNPVGAGFCTIAVGYKELKDTELGGEMHIVNVHCYGRSVTLNLDSREEDENIINDKINGL